MNYDNTIPVSCRWHAELTAFARGELDPSNRQSLADHLKNCPDCAAELVDIHAIIGSLEKLPAVQPGRDLVGPIMASVQRERALRRRRAQVLSAAAAVLIVTLSWLIFGPGRRSESDSPVSQATSWLCQSQAPDGSWHADQWGANSQFEVALAGLAISAIVCDDSPMNLSRRRHAVDHATSYLLSQQTKDGRFGPAISAAPYNHAIATMALLDKIPDGAAGAIPVAVRKALDHIIATQLPEGGWGYLNADARKANLAVTVWYLRVLRKAREHGQDAYATAFNRGMEWVMHNFKSGTGFAYTTQPRTDGSPTLTAMGSLCFLDRVDPRTITSRQLVTDVERAARSHDNEIDYYRSYFLTTALQHVGSAAAPGLVSKLRHELIAHQSQAGASSGSWNKPDRWSLVGGTIYATAMATMALNPRTHTSRNDTSAGPQDTHPVKSNVAGHDGA